MNKTETIQAIAKETGMTNTDAKMALEGIITVFANSFSKGEDIALTGFGNFKVVTRKARKGINPKTKETIKIPAKNAVTFKPSKNLKEIVNKK